MAVDRSAATRKSVITAACATVLLATGACSSSGDGGSRTSVGKPSGSGSTDATTAACVTKADDFLKSYATPPTALPYKPLSSKPAAGTVISLVNGHIPADNDNFTALSGAAKAVGWSAKKIVHQGTVEDVDSKFDQAVSEHPTVIAIDGWNVATLKNQIDSARKAGIIVDLGSVTDQPTSNPGFAVLTKGTAVQSLRARINAYKFIQASKCKGSAAIFNLPFPVLKAATDAFQETVKTNCPACKVSYNEIQAKDIGTPAATTAMISKLQSDPSVKYVYSIIADLAGGLPEALAQASISGVQIFGQTPTGDAMKALQDKKNAWWVGVGSELTAWVVMHHILLAHETKEVTAQTTESETIYTPENVGQNTTVVGYPTDFKQQFLKLWHVTE